MARRIWNIARVLKDPSLLECNIAVLVLNQPILCGVNLMRQLWDKAKVRALADGGSNSWLNFLREHSLEGTVAPPDFISGDFDSILPETRSYFEERKVQFIHTPDQDETDFRKALRCILNVMRTKALQVEYIFVVCETGGRLDQILGNLHTIHWASDSMPDHPLVLLSEKMVTWVLPPGKTHVIPVTDDYVGGKMVCGLVPLCGPGNVTTTGLQWNLNDSELEFGKAISTSNAFSATEVQISCTRNLVWSMEYAGC